MPTQNPPIPLAHDDRGSFVAIAASPYVAYAVHGAPAHMARLTRNPDGTITLHPVGAPFARLDLAVEAGRWRAERETSAAAEHVCARCAAPIKLIDGSWVGTDYTTAGDGLTRCPPDTDNPVGVHVPRQLVASARSDSGPPRPVADDTTDSEVHDLFAVHGTEPEAVWTIGALTDTDPPLRLGITALGGDTANHAGADGTWMYGLWQAQRLHRCGAVHTGAISWSHQQIAVVLAERFIDDDDLDDDIRTRLVGWLNAQPISADPA